MHPSMTSAMEIIAPIVNFGIVVGILWHFGRKPIADFFATRQAQISKEVDGARAAAVSAASELSVHSRKWADVQAAAPAEFLTFQEAFRREQQLSLTAAQEQAARLLREAGKFEASAAARMREGVEKAALGSVIELTRSALQERFDRNDQHRLVAQYVEGFTNGHSK